MLCQGGRRSRRVATGFGAPWLAAWLGGRVLCVAAAVFDRAALVPGVREARSGQGGLLGVGRDGVWDWGAVRR